MNKESKKSNLEIKHHERDSEHTVLKETANGGISTNTSMSQLYFISKIKLFSWKGLK